MKGHELADAVIESTNYAIVVETGNGKKLTTSDYYFDTNGKGEPILVIKTGREVKGK